MKKTKAFVALGGNQGDVPQTFLRAVGALERTPDLRVVQVSDCYRTEGIGPRCASNREESRFCNAALALETTLSANALLQRLQEIEVECGRVRTVAWGPRTLDLDLLLFGEEVSNGDPALQVPHPRLWYRRFVLDPLVEIAPHQRHPQWELTVSELQQRLLPQPLAVRCLGFDRENLCRLETEFGNQIALSSESTAAITLVTKQPSTNELGTIDLSSAADPMEDARWILRAALDVPKRIHSTI